MTQRLSSLSKFLILSVACLVTSVYYILQLKAVDGSYHMQAFTLLFCNAFMFFCLFIIWTRTSFYIFEPMLFVFFLYYMIFVFEPVANLSSGNVSEFGVNTMPGCIKATIVFIFGYCFMLLGYYFRDSDLSYSVQTNQNIDYDKAQLLPLCWIMWAIGVAAFLLYNMMIGRSAIYMLTFGLIGSASLNGQGYTIQILTTIIYISFVPLLCIIFYDKSLFRKIIAFIVTCAPLATRGFRNVVLVVILSPIIFYYTKKKKNPSIIILCLILIGAVFVFGFIGTTRNATRNGSNVDLSNYEFSNGTDGMLYYFDSYKVFYGAVMQYPENYEYTYGLQLAYFFIMFIPRAIWPSKPDTPIREVISNSVGPLSASSGSAWPNIGEYYTDLGIVGTMICMMLFGILLKKMKHLYDSPQADDLSLMLYAVYWPALVTLIAYGYTAGNLPQYIIMAVPVFIIRKYVKRVDQCGKEHVQGKSYIRHR